MRYLPVIFPGGVENLMPEVVETLNQTVESAHELSISSLMHDAEPLTAVDSQEKFTTVFSHDADKIAVTPINSQKKSTTVFSQGFQIYTTLTRTNRSLKGPKSKNRKL